MKPVAIVELFDYVDKLFIRETDFLDEVVFVDVGHHVIQVKIGDARVVGVAQIQTIILVKIRFEMPHDVFPIPYVLVQPHRLVLVERHEIVVVFTQRAQFEDADRHLNVRSRLRIRV